MISPSFKHLMKVFIASIYNVLYKIIQTIDFLMIYIKREFGIGIRKGLLTFIGVSFVYLDKCEDFPLRKVLIDMTVTFLFLIHKNFVLENSIYIKYVFLFFNIVLLKALNYKQVISKC